MGEKRDVKASLLGEICIFFARFFTTIGIEASRFFILAAAWNAIKMTDRKVIPYL